MPTMSAKRDEKETPGGGPIPWWRIWGRDRASDMVGYRRLAFKLHHGLPRGEADRSALVVTPLESGVTAPGSVTLACSMAEELGRPILLVDASADSEVSELLGSQAAEGLTDLVADPSRSLDDLAIETSQANVSFLPRGTREGAGVAASPEVARDLLARVHERWDFVVLAGGSVLTNGLALALAPWVGRVLLLVTENRTALDDIDEAQNTLRLCRARNVSLVLTERFDEAF